MTFCDANNKNLESVRQFSLSMSHNINTLDVVIQIFTINGNARARIRDI